MTNIEFYTELSALLENYKVGKIDHKEAVKRLTKLNLDAKKSNLELEVDVKIFESTDIVDEDYGGYDDSSYEDSYEDSYDSSY